MVAIDVRFFFNNLYIMRKSFTMIAVKVNDMNWVWLFYDDLC